MNNWFGTKKAQIIALLFSVLTVLGVLFSGLGTMLTERLFFDQRTVSKPAEGDTTTVGKTPEDVLLDAQPTVTAGAESDAEVPGKTEPKLEPFEQIGNGSQNVCNNTIALSVVPYADVSARPSRADEFKQVELTVAGEATRRLDLTKGFPLSSHCRLTGLNVFEYEPGRFGVEGMIEIGGFE